MRPLGPINRIQGDNERYRSHMKGNIFMHMKLKSYAVFLFAALLSGCGQAEIIQNAQTKGKFFEIFTKGNQDYIEAVAAEDVDKLMTFYADNAVQISPSIPIIHGADNIRVIWVAFFSDFEVLEATSTIDEVIVVGRRAFARGQYTMTYQSIIDGTIYREAGRFAESSRQLEDGQWVMTTEISSQGPPAEMEN